MKLPLETSSRAGGGNADRSISPEVTRGRYGAAGHSGVPVTCECAPDGCGELVPPQPPSETATRIAADATRRKGTRTFSGQNGTPDQPGLVPANQFTCSEDAAAPAPTKIR